MAGAALHWCFSSFRKFPKLQIAGCEEKCNTMVCTSTHLYSGRAAAAAAAAVVAAVAGLLWGTPRSGDGISVICQIYEIRSWRFRQEIITAKRYIGEEWKIIGSFPRGYYCHLQCWYQSEWCRTYKWRKLWIVFQKKSSKENCLRSN